MADRPTLQDVIAAKQRIAPYIWRTPLHHYLGLDKLLGAEVWVKHENHQVLGAFKVRGGVNLISQMSDEEKQRGVITASSGNHGQSIAYSAGLFGATCVVCVPEGANPGKIESMENLGAKVIQHGPYFDVSREHAERLAKEEGYRFVHAVNDATLIAGVGTYALEILEDLPDVDVIIVPLGGGSGASGVGIVAKSINPNIQVIAVQAERAQAGYQSWKTGTLAKSPMTSKAEGLATGMGYELPQSILKDVLDDFVLVSDEEMDRAVVTHLEKTHNLTEHAGAASLAGALKIKDRLRGKKVALVMSGGNISIEHLKGALGVGGDRRRCLPNQGY
ncbi:MAG: threonine ammonia-lyase [SAR202 cluster bacterium Casp-Chloro-G4]|nr:threonine/serine dehydratase [Chloroflexota bacterium]MDA1228823.1 threonine/serine dehydratase [Chloroflexota bacterium]PKB61087.1 MAG: threonine ammonia-lyase [SAR202 cluster bacterium Casp-Chloro-G4]